MKKPAAKYLSWLLSFVLLVSTAGVPVFAHICKSEGSKEVSVIPTEGCCSKKESKTEDDGCKKPSNCCKEEIKFLQAELPAIKNTGLQKITAPQLLLFQVLKPFLQATIYAPQIFSYLNEEGPPITAGRTLLAQISILRI